MKRLPMVALLAGAAGTALVAAGQEQRFRAGTHSVSIYATVVDAEGRLVPNLTQDDFEVFDDGKRQPLTLFDNDTQPITIVVMLDRSGSMVRQFELVRDAAREFVTHLLPDDRARLGSFSGRVQIDPVSFTSDHRELIRILHEDLQEAGPTPLWNAMSAAMTAVAHESGRRVVLVFTDGHNSPDRPDLSVSLADVRERSRAEEIMVYAIGLAGACMRGSTPAPAPGGILFQGRGGPRAPGGPVAGRGFPGRILRPGRPVPGGPIGGLPFGGRPPIVDPRVGPGRGGRSVPLGPPPPPPRDLWDAPCTSRPDPGLKELARVGGGGYFELDATHQLGETFTRVADELHRQYLLAFNPAALDGRTHKIEVRVRHAGMSVRARESYVAAAR